MTLASRVLDHLAEALCPWRYTPTTQLTAPSVEPYEPPTRNLAALHPPPPDDVDPPVVHSPYDPAEDFHQWRPGGSLSARPSGLCDEISAIHDAHVQRWAGAPADHDPNPEEMVVPYVVPGEGT